MGRNLFIDAEWFLNQRVYLIGYGYNQKEVYQLHGVTINQFAFAGILRDVDAIYCYGPDIGVMEKLFNVDLKNFYYCFNLLTIIRRLEPNLKSYKLADLEKIAGIERQTMVYKSNIWQLHKDWQNPLKRHYAMLYNREDVINLMKVKNFFFQRNGVTRKDIEKWRM